MNNTLQRSLKAILALVLILAMQSCFVFRKKTKLPGSPADHTTAATEEKQTAKDFLRHTIRYTNFEGRADANYADAAMNQNIELIVKSIRDQQSYLEVRGGMFGLTAVIATALATPDSVKAVNKWEGVYYQYKISDAAKLINAPIDFTALQQLLVGNPLFTDGKIQSFHIEGNIAKIIMIKEGFIQTLYYNTQNHQLQQLFLVNDEKQFECSIFYSNYRTLDKQVVFAFDRTIQLKLEGKSSTIDMKYSSADFQKPVDIRFSIPKTYRQVR